MGRYTDKLRALAEAFALFTATRKTGERAIARLNITPMDIAAEGAWADCHSIDVTDAGLARIMRALENGDAATAEADSLGGRQGDLVAWMADQSKRNVNSLADRDQFLTDHTDMAADLTDIFLGIDARQMNRTVLDHRAVDLPVAVRALDDVFGEIEDPYDVDCDADSLGEDGEL